MRFREQPLYARCLHPNGEEADLPIAEVEGSVPARFARMVERYADRPAMVDLRQSLTYAQLDAASNRMARAILRALYGSAAPRAASGLPVAILIDVGVLRL